MINDDRICRCKAVASALGALQFQEFFLSEYPSIRFKFLPRDKAFEICGLKESPHGLAQNVCVVY